MSIKISVIIPTYNKADLLQRTLVALSKQNLDYSQWQIVVVNDGATDNTADILKTFSEDWDGNIEIVKPDFNLGRAKARNLGADAACGEYLLFLDDDIVAPANLLYSHLALLDAVGGFGVVGKIVTSSDLIDAPHFHYIDSRGVAKIETGFVPGKYLVTQNCSLPRELFKKVGGFDEEFIAYGFEDMDLGIKLCDAGLKFRLLDNPVPIHVHHHTLNQYLEKKRECGAESLELVAEKHPGSIEDMRLDWVLDRRPGFFVKIFRYLSTSIFYQYSISVAMKWPSNSSQKPIFESVYCKLMDFLVMASFYRGYLSY
ncbi:MAG: glycosyltransferase [bacterium]|nr:glycosyltransferase [bacterium]MCP4799844.1 glycosyltransferase [bacterium]